MKYYILTTMILVTVIACNSASAVLICSGDCTINATEIGVGAGGGTGQLDHIDGTVEETAILNIGFTRFSPPSLAGDGVANVNNGSRLNVNGDLLSGTSVVRIGVSGDLAGSSGELNLSTGGQIFASGSNNSFGVIGVGSESIGVVNISGDGSLFSADNHFVGANVGGVEGVGAVGTVNVSDGGIFQARNGGISIGLGAGTGLVNVEDGGVVTVGDNIVVGNDNLDFNPNIGEPLSGELRIASGGLVVAPEVIIEDFGTLSGDGVLLGNVINEGGVVGPGFSPGRLTIDGDFSMDAGRLVIEVEGITTGLFDVLDVSGSIDITGGELFFDFADFLPSANDMFQFLIAGNGTSISNAVSFGFGGAALGFDFDIDRSSGVFVALNDAQPVPEPGTLALLFFGLLGLGAIRFIAQPRP